MDINSIMLSVLTFVLIVGIMFFLEFKEQMKTKKLSDLEKLNSIEDEENQEESQKKKKKINFALFGNLDERLIDSEIKVDPTMFTVGMFILTFVVCSLMYWVFNDSFVSIAPIPFCIYFLPKMIFAIKSSSVMKKFDLELVIVLRRMASVLHNGSMLQALEDVKDLPNLSRKMRLYLNHVHHKFSYGDDIIDAFRNSVGDIQSETLQSFIRTADLNKELGADLANTLNDMAMRIQELDLTTKEANSLMASTKTIGTFIGVIPFFIMFYMKVSNPTYFTDYLTTFDHSVVFFCILSMIFFGIYALVTFADVKKR